MTNTTNLALTLLEVGQKEKEVTINGNMALIDQKATRALADSATPPATTGLAPGSTYYNTTDSKMYWLRPNLTWVTSSGGGGGGGAVDSFNTRTGAVTLTSGDVTTALTFTPYNATNPAGYISSISSGDVTTALTFTPYNATNPAGYTTNTGTVTSVGATSANTAISISGSPVTSSGSITVTSNVFNSTNPGHVPASGGGTSNFLRADGTFAAPPGGGGGTAWGAITGTLSAQTDLQSALDLKAPLIVPVFSQNISVVPPSTVPASVLIYGNNDDASLSGGAVLSLLRSKNTYGSPTAVVSGNQLSVVNSLGYDGSAYAAGSSITANATENWTGTANGTNVQINAVGTGTTTQYGIINFSHNGTRRLMKLGTTAGGVTIEYEGNSSANRPIIQATSGTNTALVSRAPASASTSSAQFRADSSSDTTTYNSFGFQAYNDNISAGAYRIYAFKAVAGVFSDATDPIAFSGGITNTIWATVNPGTTSVNPTDLVRKSELDALVRPPSTVAGQTSGSQVGQMQSVTNASTGVTVTAWNGTNWIDMQTGTTVV